MRMVTKSSGMYSKNLGLRDSEIRLMKAELIVRISRVIEARALTQGEASDALGISQGNVSKLLNGRLGGSSTDRLLSFLTRFGQRVTITTEPKRGGGLGVA